MNAKIRPDKSYGQHFLINQGIIQKIADTVARLAVKLGNMNVVEIGPGPGALTEALLQKKLNVLAVELDSRMVASLAERFAPAIASNSLQLLEKDATKLDPALISSKIGSAPYVMCGNLPYNVGTAILFNALEDLPDAHDFCFMLQKEVVQRLKADKGTKSYGIPSIKFAWSVDVLDHFWVSPGSFSPPPKVDSGVITYRRKTSATVLAEPRERQGLYDEASKLVNRLFQTRRKMIGSTVKELRNSPSAKLRPEDLDPADFIALHRLLVAENSKIV